MENPLNRYYEREFAELDNMKSHRALAATAALYLCKLDGQVPPHWVVQEAAELLCDLLAGKSKKRGRAASPIARYRQDLIELERWEAVRSMRQAQKRVLNEVKEIRRRESIPDSRRRVRSQYKNDRLKMHAWLGKSFSRALECAAHSLRGRDAFGSPSTMLKSYKKLQKHIKAVGDRQSPSYWLIDDRFLQRIGFKSLLERRKGTKTLPLYILE